MCQTFSLAPSNEQNLTKDFTLLTTFKILSMKDEGGMRHANEFVDECQTHCESQPGNLHHGQAVKKEVNSAT